MVHWQKRRGVKPLILNGRVTTSGRRWKEKGVVPVFLLNQAIILAWHAGVPPEQLKRVYYNQNKRMRGEASQSKSPP